MFGGRLARQLIAEGQTRLIIAGRSLSKARAFCEHHGGQPRRIDLADPDLAAQIAALDPVLIVDAAGPFQSYGANPYRVVEAALQTGAHYLDLCDDADFSAGITALNAAAKSANISLISGVSSVPAISSCVADALTTGMTDIHLIESAILPGNRAPRGRSVMQSILSQVGQPIKVQRGGRTDTPRGWSLAKKITLQTGQSGDITRVASLIGAPDLKLFPGRYGAHSVLFRAGLELSIMQQGLAALGWLAARTPLRPVSLLGPLKWIADQLEPLGSDKGGMQVRVVGIGPDGEMTEHNWTLIAEAGDGPGIPAVPAKIMIHKLLAGEVPAGARPCLGAFSMDELTKGLAPLQTLQARDDHPYPALFSTLLAEAFKQLPPQLQDLHTVGDRRIWRGEATITRGGSLLSKVAGWIAGFPKASKRIDVEVEMTRTGGREVWRRRFGKKSFRSVLSARLSRGQLRLQERFGVFSFDIDLTSEQGEILFPVRHGRCLGLPLPDILCPRSETREYVDEAGRACFDVAISLPLAGPVVHYRGWLAPL